MDKNNVKIVKLDFKVTKWPCQLFGNFSLFILLVTLIIIGYCKWINLCVIHCRWTNYYGMTQISSNRACDGCDQMAILFSQYLGIYNNENFPEANKCAKISSEFCQLRNGHIKIAKDLFKFCHSHEKSPNLVTLHVIQDYQLPCSFVAHGIGPIQIKMV